MVNSRRWLDDDAPPEIRRLLNAARREVPPRRAVDRAVVVVGSAGALGVATTTASGAAAKVASSSLGLAVAKWGAAAVFGLGVATATTATVRHYALTAAPTMSAAATRSLGGARSEATVRHAVVLAPGGSAHAASGGTSERTEQSSTESSRADDLLNGSTRSDPGTPDASASAPLLRVAGQSHRVAALGRALAVTVPATVRADAAVTASAQNPNTPASSHAASDAQLLEEMRFLDRARALMLSGQATNAMRWLREYRRNFPAERLMPEALLLGLQAAVRQGELSNALGIAREIWARFPDSPHAAKARELLDASARRSTEHPSEVD